MLDMMGVGIDRELYPLLLRKISIGRIKIQPKRKRVDLQINIMVYGGTADRFQVDLASLALSQVHAHRMRDHVHIFILNDPQKPLSDGRAILIKTGMNGADHEIKF